MENVSKVPSSGTYRGNGGKYGMIFDENVICRIRLLI